MAEKKNPSAQEEEHVTSQYGKEYFPEYDEEEKELTFPLPEYDDSLAYCGFQLRSLACMFDMAIMLFFMGLLGQYLLRFLGVLSPLEVASDRAAFVRQVVVVNVIEVALYVLYCFGCWIKWGATPGKLLFGMHIVDAKTGEAPTRIQWVKRALGYFLSSAFFMLGFLWIIGQRRKQGWHDRIAHTVVIRNRRRYRILWQWAKKRFKKE